MNKVSVIQMVAYGIAFYKQGFDLLCHLVQDQDGRSCHAADSGHGGDEAHTSLPTRNGHDEEPVSTGMYSRACPHIFLCCRCTFLNFFSNLSLKKRQSKTECVVFDSDIVSYSARHVRFLGVPNKLNSLQMFGHFDWKQHYLMTVG